MVVVPVLVACGWLVVVVGGEGGEGVFLGEVKARRKDIISSSLDYQKQKLSTDKQFIFKPQFTRHAGKAGGFWVFFCIGFMLYLDLLKHPPGVRILRFSFVSSNK